MQRKALSKSAKSAIIIFAGDVDDEQGFAGVVGEGGGLALDGLRVEVVGVAHERPFLRYGLCVLCIESDVIVR